MMKKCICLIFILFNFCYAANALAQVTLQFEFEGISDALLKNVQTRLELNDKSELQTDDVQSSYKDASAEIRKALQPYGYFNPTITSQLQQNSGINKASFSIQLGPAIKITKVIVEVVGPAQSNARVQKYLANFPLKEGDVFASQNYQDAKEKLFQIVNEQGFIKASFSENRVLVDLKKYEVTIIMRLNSGDRYYFGNVNFSDSPYSKDFLQRFITFKQDDPFSSKKLIAFQQALTGNYYFTQIVAVPDFNHIDNYHVPINITIEAPKSQKYNIGVGYGTFSKARITAGVSLRRTTDTGQHFDAQMQYSNVLYGLSAKYFIPGKDPLNDQWIIGANLQKFMPDNDTKSYSTTFSGGYNTKIGNLTTNLSLNYLLERYQIDNSAYKSSNLLYPNLNLSYTKTDNLINPSNGYNITFNLLGSGPLSTTSFLQGELSGKYMISPTNWNKILVRGDFGYTVAKDYQEKLPLTMRFTTGGVNSIRGFKDSSIGPGRYLEVGSVEYRNKIYGNLDAAVFYDIGTATDHFGTELNRGAGVGLVYNSAIGPIKLYAAQALSKKDSPRGLYFSIGPEF